MAAISNFQLSVIVQPLKLSLLSASTPQRTVPSGCLKFTRKLALLLVKTTFNQCVKSVPFSFSLKEPKRRKSQKQKLQTETQGKAGPGIEDLGKMVIGKAWYLCGNSRFNRNRTEFFRKKKTLALECYRS